MNSLFHFTPTRNTIISFLAVMIVGIYSINLVIIAAGVAIIYYSLKQVPIQLFQSRISGLLGALFIYTITIAAVGSVADIFNTNFNILYSPSLALILLSLSLAIYFRTTEKNNKVVSDRFERFSRTDRISILIAFFVIASFVMPPFLRYGFEGGLIGQVNANVDDSVHIAMLNDRLHFNQDYFLDNSPEHIRAEDKISYPATWHTANAVLINAVVPHIGTGIETLIAYVISKITWTIILIYFLVRSTLLRIVIGNKKRAAIYLSVGLLLLFSYIAAVSQFLFGFYNFIPQLISLLVLSSIAFTTVSRDQKNRLLLVGTIVAIGGGMLWFLLLPVMAVSLLIVLFCSFIKKPFKEISRVVWRSFTIYPLLYIVLITAVLQQAYIATMSAEAISFIQNIILSGEVARYSQVVFITISIGVIAFLFRWNKKQDADISSITWLTAVLTLFAGFILAICLIKTQEPRYYYFKVLSAIIVILIPLCIAGFVKLFQSIENQIDNKLQWPVITIFLASLAISILPSFSSTGNILSYMKGERPTTPSSINSVFHSIQSQSRYYDTSTSYKFYYDYRSFPQNFINTMLVKANQSDNNCFRGVLNTLIADNSAVSMAHTAKSNICESRRIVIIVPERDYLAVKKILTLEGSSERIILTKE